MKIDARAGIDDFVVALRVPRTITTPAPASPPVGSAISDLFPPLKNGDLIVEAGNPIQAERDYFGEHSYQGIDAKGAFHAARAMG